MADVNGKAARTKAPKDRKPTGKTTLYLKPQDRAHAAKIIEAGWAISTTGAIRFALKFTAEKVAA